MNFDNLKKYIPFKKDLIDNVELLKLDNIEEIQNNLLINSEKIGISNLDLIKLYYLNRKKIHNELFKNQKIIGLENDKVIENISYYFYLDLLIKDNIDIVNYSYSIKFIKNIKNQKTDLKKFIISKIILDLIDNYEGLYECIYNFKEKEKIKLDNINILIKNIYLCKELEIKLNIDNLKYKKMDEIYAEIIISLIKNNKLENSYDIINQLDLISIDITNIMFTKINDFFDKNEHLVEKYVILKEEDLYNVRIINFYYILFKYIIKNPIIISKMKFILKSKSTIKLINSNQKILKSINIQNLEMDIKLRLKYILEIINILNYDEKDIKFNNNINLLDIIQYNKLENDKIKVDQINQEDINTNLGDNLSSFVGRSTISSSQNDYISSDNSHQNFLQNTDNEEVKKELSSNKELEYIDKKEKYKLFNNVRVILTHENTADYIMEIREILITGGTDDKINIYDLSNKTIIKINIKDWFYNVLEFNLDNDNWIIGSTKGKIILFSLEGRTIELKEFKTQKLDRLVYLLKTPENDNKKNYKYYCCEENSISYIEKANSKINQIMSGKLKENILAKSGILINNKILAFKSNKVASLGKDELLFFNTKKEDFINYNIKTNYSFTFSANGMTLFEDYSKINKNKILLCACKKYVKNQENGILLINIEEDDNLSSIFYNTNHFEVFCFHQNLSFKIKII